MHDVFYIPQKEGNGIYVKLAKAEEYFQGSQDYSVVKNAFESL